MSAAPRFRAFDVDACRLARRLLGQRLVHRTESGRCAGIIVETEAYLGTDDRAAHAYGGHRSPRNESMYAEGGHAYVYFIYGMHHCMNVVCGRRDEPVAVLLRALLPTEGLEEMRRRRGRSAARELCAGPGRLTQALAIDRSCDGIDLRVSPVLFIERLRQRALPGRLVTVTPRIGVDYAGDWADRPLRFVAHGLSQPHPNGVPSGKPWPSNNKSTGRR